MIKSSYLKPKLSSLGIFGFGGLVAALKAGEFPRSPPVSSNRRLTLSFSLRVDSGIKDRLLAAFAIKLTDSRLPMSILFLLIVFWVFLSS